MNTHSKHVVRVKLHSIEVEAALASDLDLEWVAPDEAMRLLVARLTPDATMLFVAFERDWPRRARLDLLVDGERVGQLLPGTAMLLPLPSGLRTVQAFLNCPRTMVSELVNVILLVASPVTPCAIVTHARSTSQSGLIFGKSSAEVPFKLDGRSLGSKDVIG